MNNKRYFYGKAPNIFQKTLQRVAFDVEDDDHSDSYRPSCQFVEREPTFVLCEDLNTDDEPKCIQLTPRNFWDFLYSNAWGDEFTLRVMSGYLQHCLLHSLNVMEREHIVSTHCNFALVKNNRRLKRQFFRNENQQVNQGDNHVDEVLLIDLTCYAKRMQDNEHVPTVRLSHPSIITTPRSMPDKNKQNPDKKRLVPVAEWRPFQVSLVKSHKYAVDKVKTIDTGLLGSEGPVKSVSISKIAEQRKSYLKECNIKLKLKKEKEMKMSKSPPLAKKVARANKEGFAVDKRGHTPLFSVSRVKEMSTILEYDLKPELKWEKKKSITHQPITIEFKFPVNPAKTQRLLRRWNLKGLGYIRKPIGEEYYLKENNVTTARFPGTPIDKLHHNLHKRLLEKEEEKKEQKELKDMKENMLAVRTQALNIEEPEEPPHDSIIKVFEHPPDFMEVLAWINEGKEGKRKKKKKYLTKREPKTHSEINMPELNSQLPSPTVTIKIDEHREHIINLIDPTVGTKPSYYSKASRVQTKTSPIQVVLVEPQRLYDKDKGLNEASHKSLHASNTNSKTVKHAVSLNVNSKHKYKTSSGISAKLGQSSKSKIYSEELVIPPSCTNWISETTDLNDKANVEDEQIDTAFFSKLNKAFSHDQFLKKNKHIKLSPKSRPRSKKPKERTKCTEKKSSKKTLMLSSPKTKTAIKANKSPEPETTIMEVGKLKKFKFLDYSDYKAKDLDIQLPDFNVSNRSAFNTKLQKALEDFVIRKENIMTDCGYKHVLSITFTRPAVFKKFNL